MVIMNKRKPKAIIIIANGAVRDIAFHRALLKKAGIIICADGGANNAARLGITPDYVIGDLDSIDKSILKRLQKTEGVKIIFDPNQDKTDLELAITLAESFTPGEITILGAIGDRLDHTMANIFCLNKIRNDIKARIIDEKNEIQLVDSAIELIGKKGDIVSVIPLTPIKNLTYDGLQWEVKNSNSEFGWFGVCNKMTKNKAGIKFDSGRILVIKVKNQSGAK